MSDHKAMGELDGLLQADCSHTLTANEFALSASSCHSPMSPLRAKRPQRVARPVSLKRSVVPAETMSPDRLGQFLLRTITRSPRIPAYDAVAFDKEIMCDPAVLRRACRFELPAGVVEVRAIVRSAQLADQKVCENGGRPRR